MPNAGRQALPIAGATQERRLLAVACTPLLGAARVCGLLLRSPAAYRTSRSDSPNRLRCTTPYTCLKRSLARATQMGTTPLALAAWPPTGELLARVAHGPYDRGGTLSRRAPSFSPLTPPFGCVRDGRRLARGLGVPSSRLESRRRIGLPRCGGHFFGDNRFADRGQRDTREFQMLDAKGDADDRDEIRHRRDHVPNG